MELVLGVGQATVSGGIDAGYWATAPAVVVLAVPYVVRSRDVPLARSLRAPLVVSIGAQHQLRRLSPHAAELPNRNRSSTRNAPGSNQDSTASRATAAIGSRCRSSNATDSAASPSGTGTVRCGTTSSSSPP